MPARKISTLKAPAKSDSAITAQAKFETSGTESPVSVVMRR